MKVRKLLELQANIEERKIPCDLCDDELNQHYSQSKDKAIDILDMDLIHLIRSYNKCLDMDLIHLITSYSKSLHHRDDLKSQEILDDLDVIENRISSVKFKFLNS